MSTSKRKRIVAIDDDVHMLKLIHDILADFYQVMTISNPAEAVDIILKNPPNLILLDLMFAEMSGWDIYNQVKRDERTEDIPFIVVTASQVSIDRVFAMHIAHVASFINKPFTAQELLGSVERALEGQSSD
ncbi:MAG TPA: response regulator [Aggregatilineales bacterium]|nr:response regulator [Aggregatilineales bacterium]